MNNELRVWQFVEDWYPDYYHADEIVQEGDLDKLANKEYQEGDCAHQLLMDEYDGDINNPRIKIDAMSAYIEVLEAAIENYLKSKQNESV